jgi:hypothetical protein
MQASDFAGPPPAGHSALLTALLPTVPRTVRRVAPRVLFLDCSRVLFERWSL